MNHARFCHNLLVLDDDNKEVNHGHYDLFLVDETSGMVTSGMLDFWLSNSENATGVDQIAVIIDAYKSGSFIDVTAEDYDGWDARSVAVEMRTGWSVYLTLVVHG